LALFRRRPPERVDSLAKPASENLHKSGRHALLHRGKRMLSSALQVRWHSVESAANELAKSQACCDDENGTLRRGVLGRARGVIAKA
jgi:hypothetical protein